MTGHLPTGYSDPRAGHARNGAGAGPIALAQLVSDLRVAVAAAYAVTRSSWDPRTGPQQQDPYSESDVDIRMSAIGADLRSALSGLDGLRALTSFPVGAVAPGVGGRPAGMGVAVPAGASSPVGPGSEPTPGSAVAFAGRRAKVRDLWWKPAPGASSPAGPPEKEPSPGSAAALAGAVRESDDVGAVVAGTSSGLTDCGQSFAHHWHMFGEHGQRECSGVVSDDFTLPRPPEFSMRSALNAALNRRT